ncbi:hypothetical protein BJ322DRAFT_1034115 [Thelephora terrestris]|uniref:TPR-like protein n=1 Tax=Thelephora terrestris TaxID=56493 RepID=A0A9P6HRD4_9AGAM|nr:hypothetical protein BJ322DRAFT_1034115 [Thelephora terrestris]
MDANESQRPKARDRFLSALNAAIESLNHAKEGPSVAPARNVFGSVSTLLTIVRGSMNMANRTDYVELGLACADICRALDRGMNGEQADRFNGSLFEAIEQLTTTVAEIQSEVDKLGERRAMSRLIHAKDDKDTIAAWKLDLNRILHVFNTELEMNTHVAVLNTQDLASKIHRTLVERQDGADGRNPSTQTSTSGESPPPRPRACFGRGELIEKIVGFAENLTPVALIGAGGIGKTSIALVVLHHDRIKERFGDNRRFIRCDQFPASGPHFLSRLSKAIGAGIENPEDFTPLRPFLSSKEMFIFLDNAESILDPQATNGREIYRLVEELSQFSNICLAITSRITTVPPDCETLEVQTLSTEAAQDTFYRIYKYGKQSGSVSGILEELDFHPLSVVLLATVAHQNRWDNDRLVKEWEERQTGVLQTEHQTSLAATIELSLASLMFQKLGPDAMGILGVVAFYPQGIDEKNLEWLFPTVSDRTHIFDKLCMLSLAYRSNGFITMLAPLRDHLRPKDPKTSPLLCTTKGCYFARLSTKFDTQEGRWIMSEDVNVEHLLDVFASADPSSDDVWYACARFMGYLWWHKPRPTVLRKSIEELSDDNSSKPDCLYGLAYLYGAIGNFTEQALFLGHALKVERERGNDSQVAKILQSLSDSNRVLNRHEEGIDQAREAMGIYERLGRTMDRVGCLASLARLLNAAGQLDAAEEAIAEVFKLLPEKGQEHRVWQLHQTLGDIYHSKGEIEKALYNYKMAVGIASTLGNRNLLFWIQMSLAELFLSEGRLDDAQLSIEQAKPLALDDTYQLGLAVYLQAEIYYRQRRLKDAASEALRAQEIFEKFWHLGDPRLCKALLQIIEEAMQGPPPSVESDTDAPVTGALSSTPQDLESTLGRLSVS